MRFKRLAVQSAVDRRRDAPRVEGTPWVIFGTLACKRLSDLQPFWRRARAGVKDVRIHDLRHTFALTAVASGQGLPKALHRADDAKIAPFRLDAHVERAVLGPGDGGQGGEPHQPCLRAHQGGLLGGAQGCEGGLPRGAEPQLHGRHVMAGAGDPFDGGGYADVTIRRLLDAGRPFRPVQRAV